MTNTPEQTEALILRLDSWLRKNCPAYYDFLQPGISDAEIIDFEKALGLELPLDFKLFYKWKNGIPVNKFPEEGYGDLVPSYYWDEARKVVASHEMMNEPDKDGYYPGWENWWNPGWVGFIGDFTANEICLDTAGTFGGRPGQILSVRYDDEERTIVHESFYKWLETTVLALEAGIFAFDGEDNFRYYPAYW